MGGGRKDLSYIEDVNWPCETFHLINVQKLGGKKENEES